MAEPVKITVDASDMKKLNHALAEVGEQVRSRILVSALNRTGDSSFTQLKRIAADKSGRTVTYAASRIQKKVAFSGKLQYEMKARDWWSKITAGDFKAREAGETIVHRAWQGGTVRRSFIIAGVAFHRPDRKRKPLYGPNVAREIERNIGEVKAMVNGKLKDVFVPRVHHELDRAVRSTKGKYGL